jgi:hypothetical protein
MMKGMFEVCRRLLGFGLTGKAAFVILWTRTGKLVTGFLVFLL